MPTAQKRRSPKTSNYRRITAAQVVGPHLVSGLVNRGQQPDVDRGVDPLKGRPLLR